MALDIMTEHHKLYNTKTWKILRNQMLSSDPVCKACLQSNKVTPAHHIDHIVPHKGDISIFKDLDNLQSLCLECHSKKTQLEKRGVFMDYNNNTAHFRDSDAEKFYNSFAKFY